MNKENSKITNSISRRDFIKLSGTVGAVAALSDFSFGGPIRTLVAGAKPEQTVQEDVWIPTACYRCDRNCGLLAHRVNGVIVKIEGNPANPDNRGRICARSQANIAYLYHPWRIKAPMKRTNPEKGRDVDPKWVEITWDEAMNTITEKLKAVKDKDPRGFVFFTGHRGANMRDPVTRQAFCPAFGSPNSGVYSGGGMYCSGFALHPTGCQMFGTFVFGNDTNYARLIISQGSGSDQGAKATPGTNREFVELKEKGVKFVAIDTWAGTSIQKTDQWIPIRPSSDLAFMDSVINVIINELQTYDAEFLKKRTNANYLIGPDGFYVRSTDENQMVKDPSRLNQVVGKPLVWDSVDAAAKTFDDPTLKDTALTGTYTVGGVQARPAFQVLKDTFKDYTPEWAEKLTTVPAAEIRSLAKEWVDTAQIGSTITIDGYTFPLRPVCWAGGRGAHNHQWGYDTHHAEALLNMLVGAFGVPGGVQGSEGGGSTMTMNPADGVHIPGPAYARYKSIKFPPETAFAQELYPVSYKMHPLIYKAILDPKPYYLSYSIEAALISGAGIMAGAAEPDTIAAALKKIPFIFSINYQFDEPDQMADIVLPDSTFLERYYVAGCDSFTPDAHGAFYNEYDVLRQPVLEKPVYNSRDASDVVIDLAERLGILYGKGGVNDRINNYQGFQKFKLDLNKKYTMKEITDLWLKEDSDGEHGLDWYQKNALGKVASKSVTEYYAYTQSKGARHPFYNDYMLWVGKQWASELKKNNITLPGVPNNDFCTSSCHALPIYNPDPQIGGPKPVSAEYDLWAVHGKTFIHSMTDPMSQGWFAELVQLYDPYAMMASMHPDAAKARGLKDGDPVVLESAWGKTNAWVKVTELVHPEAVGLLGCFGFRSTGLPASTRVGPHSNELATLDQLYMTQRSVGFENRIKVKVYKA
jgi:anaerobic selenocysteine-containing dehydrogenase